MPEDLLKSLGHTTLGSRLKRLGERLQAQTHDLMRDLDGPLPAVPHNPVLAALDRHGPMRVGDLAAALGQSQPGITRIVTALKKDGLVAVRRGSDDKRVSTVTLTKKGAALTGHLKARHWPAVDEAVRGACAGLSGPLLDQLAQLEDALAEMPLKDRVPARGRSDGGGTA